MHALLTLGGPPRSTSHPTTSSCPNLSRPRRRPCGVADAHGDSLREELGRHRRTRTPRHGSRAPSPLSLASMLFTRRLPRHSRAHLPPRSQLIWSSSRPRTLPSLLPGLCMTKSVYRATSCRRSRTCTPLMALVLDDAPPSFERELASKRTWRGTAGRAGESAGAQGWGPSGAGAGTGDRKQDGCLLGLSCAEQVGNALSRRTVFATGGAVGDSVAQAMPEERHRCMETRLVQYANGPVPADSSNDSSSTNGFVRSSKVGAPLQPEAQHHPVRSSYSGSMGHGSNSGSIGRGRSKSRASQRTQLHQQRLQQPARDMLAVRQPPPAVVAFLRTS
ncbi:hypothetical protein MSAN_02045500 [Mycena sanguinolenta]|uniref:Uncharacterized protein n=1 Tax=Mycena sanguinolenta TaxID=230812 RepID=A0A8H6XK56_9AGAR|nr:hypothetical protein MSAN_02045500 [Mycena sanguinolenta]